MPGSIPSAANAASENPIHLGDVLKDGLVAGLAGALVVAIAHGIADIAAGEPLRTPTLLGVLFARGPEAARVAQPDLAVAFRFTALHMSVWVVLGVAASALVSWVDSRPRFASLAFASFAFVFVSASYLAGVYDVPGLPPLHLWVGTLLGAGAAAAWLAWRHPNLARHIERERMTETTRREIARALAFETRGTRAIEEAATRLPHSPLAEIAPAKRGRVTILSQLASQLGLPDVPDGEPAWQATGLEECLRAALAHEREVVELYDRFLAVVPEMRIRDAFVRLRYHAEDETLRRLEEALDASA